LKEITGREEEQAVKVAGNGGGGTQRVWKPAAMASSEGTAKAGHAGFAGSEFFALGAPEG
jgi:hypothetical protein